MFIARQPIFNRDMHVYGYELLFREASDSTAFGNTSADKATASVLGGLFEQGVKQIVDGKKAFINFEYDFLRSGAVELISSDDLVIEVLESVEVDEPLLARLSELREKGYRIALDDFDKTPETYPAFSIADIIKYDLLLTPLDTLQSAVSLALREGKILLAEKIETDEDFQKAKEMGFHLFQGFFFSRPNIVGKSEVKRFTKTHFARIMDELHKKEPSYQNIAQIIETDVDLAYRLLRVVSHHSDKKSSFRSIKKALVAMGLQELERWIHVLMLQELSADKPMELTRLSLVRYKFGDFIALHSKYRKRNVETSMMCLFSLLDTILDQSMEHALSDIDLSKDVKDALIKKSGTLMPIYALISSYESGYSNIAGLFAEEVGISEEALFEGYLASVQWADDVLRSF